MTSADARTWVAPKAVPPLSSQEPKNSLASQPLSGKRWDKGNLKVHRHTDTLCTAKLWDNAIASPSESAEPDTPSTLNMTAAPGLRIQGQHTARHWAVWAFPKSFPNPVPWSYQPSSNLTKDEKDGAETNCHNWQTSCGFHLGSKAGGNSFYPLLNRNLISGPGFLLSPAAAVCRGRESRPQSLEVGYDLTSPQPAQQTKVWDILLHFFSKILSLFCKDVSFPSRATLHLQEGSFSNKVAII